MVTTAVIFLLFVLLGLNIRNVYVIKQLRSENENRTLATRSDDEDVLAMLEAQSSTSTLAQHLLATARAGSGKLLESGSAHSSSTGEPQDEASQESEWKFIWQQYELEESDESRVRTVQRYVHNGISFTGYQKTQFLSLLEDEDERDECRGLLYPPKREPSVIVDEPVPFRWSKQKLKMLVTMTCRCGKPAEFTSGPQLTVRCIGACARACDTDIQMTGNMLFINPDGSAWRYVGSGEWCKAAID